MRQMLPRRSIPDERVSALRDGLRRVHGAPAILIGMWLATVLTLPLALTVRGIMLPPRDASSEAAPNAGVRTIADEWTSEFSAQATGTAARTTVVGFGAVLNSPSALADRLPRLWRSSARRARTVVCGCSSPAASSTVTRATGRRARSAFSVRGAASSAASSGSGS